MSGSGQPSERSPKDVRIVYHFENRIFARLFNECTLEQVKDVVRRKLGLGRETGVSLKQMGPDGLLDLEDDDDFQAFRVFVKSCVSVDIQVAVGKSRGSPVAPPSVIESPVTLPSEESAGSATAAGKSSARPEAASTTETVTATKRTLEPSARKRKVSFGPAAVVTPDKPAEQRAQSKPVAVTPVSSAKAVETPAAPTPVGAEEPPKKRRKKEIVKAKDVQPTEGVESPSTKASKPKAKESTALDHASKAGTSAPKDGGTSEPPTKKPRKQKKDDSTVPNKSSAPAKTDGMGQPISEPVDDTSLQPASEKPAKSGRVSKSVQGEKKIGVCAAIPRTSASTTVQSEVATAILSGILFKASETIPPPPPAKRKPVKKDTKKSSASSSALLAKSTTVSHAPANEVPNVSTEHRLEHVVPIHEPLQQTQELNGPPCPICLEEPFHIRYRCPTVLQGPDAIRERLEEVKRTDGDDQQSLIKELEGLLRDSEVTSESSLNAALPRDVQSREALRWLSASISRTPNIPTNSNLSEVTVESRDEGSSSESSDDIPEERVEHVKEFPPPGKQKTPDEQPLPSNDDLEAVIRGPVLKRQSILHVLDRIVADADVKNSDSDEDQDELEEEDPDEEHSRRRLSKHIMHSSDSESEEEESRSPSLSLSAEDNLESGVQGSNSPVEESTEHQDDDVVMRDCVNPRVLGGQDGDSSEETHVGSEDRMVVDDPIGEKGTVAIVEERLSSPIPRTSVLQPSDAPSNEAQESGQTEVDPASSSAQVASKIPNEADPIEPADDLDPPTISRPSNTDPIESPPEDIGSLITGVTQSTPNPGVTKRIKARNGQILDDEAERPVLLEQLTTETTEEATPLPTKGKSRRKVTEMSTSQEPASTRRSPRFSSLPPSTSTPAAVALLNHRAKVGARSGKAAKTPAKRSGQRTDASQSSTKGDNAQNGVRIAPTPSLIEWETLVEPSSPPSLQLDEPSVRIDELMSSSPKADDDSIHGRLNGDDKKSRPRKPALSTEAESSQGTERLFDLSSSQIPFPYSQHKKNPASTAFPNGKEKEVITESEEETPVTKKKAKMPVRYRSLSQLASQATLFSPSLATPANKSMTNGKTKKRVADKDSSSSSSSSDDDEANGSEHIPRGRRAGSVLESKKKRGLVQNLKLSK